MAGYCYFEANIAKRKTATKLAEQREKIMKSSIMRSIWKGRLGRSTSIAQAALLAIFAAQCYGQSPWETAVSNLVQAFTGPIAKGLSLVAIVIGGLTFAYSEGGSKKQFAGLVFGIGMAVSATAFMAWLFGV